MNILVVACIPSERVRVRRLVADLPDHAVASLAFVDFLDKPALRRTTPHAVIFGSTMQPETIRPLLQRLGCATLPAALIANARSLKENGALPGSVVRVALAGPSAKSFLRTLILLTRARQPDQYTGPPPAVVLDSIADAVLTVDARGKVCYMNEAASRLTCTALADALGLAVGELMVLREVSSGMPVDHPASEVLSSGRTVRMIDATVLVRRDGSHIIIQDSTAPMHDDDGAICGAVMVFHDVSEAHQLRAQADYLAWHDFLTGLPNRFAAQRHLALITTQAHARQLPLAVMYLDLDRFKTVNDTMGHAAGDQVLISAGARLRACFRPADLVSRQGGDEFVVSMAPGTGMAEAAASAERIRSAISLPFEIGDESVAIGCSIGIALFPDHGASGEALLRHADMALNSAKSNGRNGWRFFEPELLSSAVRRREIESGMRDALERAQFELHYQPKIRLDDGALCGCEALLRWHHPQWGWVDPSEIIRYAEESGQIVALGRWVLDSAIEQAQIWEKAGACPTSIAINISAIELVEPGFADYIGQRLAATGLSPARLQLELTESALMGDMATASAVLGRLKMLGVSLAVDDFGTGYSSLSYLAEFPIDLLKIDRSFVHRVTSASPRRQDLLRAVLALASQLSLPVVAEGIESAQEADFLTEAGCLLGQGYYYGRALRPSEFAAAFLHPDGGAR